MRALNPSEVVSPLEALFDSILGRKRLASEKREASEVHSRQIPAERWRQAVMQAPPRKLKAEFVEQIAADRRGVLADDGEVARLLLRSTRPGVLPEVLILGIHLDSCDCRR